MPTSLDSSRPIMAPSPSPALSSSLTSLLLAACLLACWLQSLRPFCSLLRLVLDPFFAFWLFDAVPPDSSSHTWNSSAPATAATVLILTPPVRSPFLPFHSSLPSPIPPKMTAVLTETPVPQVRASVRYSTYSMAPSFANTVQTTDSAHAEIADIATGLDRMENKALSSQRVTLSEEKTANMSKLALGAKLERALDRRMSSQDAVMRPRGKTLTEKTTAA